MISIKTKEELEIMVEGGRRLARVKNTLEKKIREGVSAYDMEVLANTLIKKEKGKASFKTVPGYSWATCVNVNNGLVHGIPRSEIVFKARDVVSIDIGIYHQGFHTDTSITTAIDPDDSTRKFLEIGKEALEAAIGEARVGKHIYNVSKAMEDIITGAGYSPIRALVGHGVGRELHEDPQIPCFLPGKITDSPEIAAGMVFAIEVMYAMGAPEVEMAEDGWTIQTRDGKISGLFEETVAVTSDGPKVLTRL